MSDGMQGVMFFGVVACSVGTGLVTNSAGYGIICLGALCIGLTCLVGFGKWLKG